MLYLLLAHGHFRSDTPTTGYEYVQWLLSREIVSPSVLAQIDTTVVNQILRMIQSNVKNSVPGISMNPI